MDESAGGHLVAMVGVHPTKETRVEAVADFYGPYDIVKRETDRGEVTKPLAQLLGIYKLDEAGLAKLKLRPSPSSTVSRTLPWLTLNRR